MATKPGTITIENARLLFRNFSGKEGQYNREGDRNFAVVIDDPKLSEQLVADGWNVKFLKPREEDEEPTPYLQVSVKYANVPPHVVLISSRGRNDLGEDEVEVLDFVEIRTADIIINPYEWVVNGKSGIKAYLKTAFITIEEDELERKYAEELG